MEWISRVHRGITLIRLYYDYEELGFSWHAWEKQDSRVNNSSHVSLVTILSRYNVRP